METDHILHAVDLRCGFGSWKPKCLQVFNRSGWVVTFLCVGNFCQSFSVNGLLGVMISTIETRFDLSSSQSSWIASCYDVGTVPALLVMSFIGTRLHRPKAVSLGLLVLSLGCLLMFLPHFVTPIYRPRETAHLNLCQNDSSKMSCQTQTDSATFSRYLPMFLIASLLMGVGSTPMYTMGVTYIDDCASKEKFALYVGIFYAMGVIGPAVGTIGGGFLLNLFTDFPSLTTELDIDSSSSIWVGAWWLGFVVAMALCILSALPICAYARDIPGAAETRKTKTSEAHTTGEALSVDSCHEAVDYTRDCSDLARNLKVLFTNPTYVMLCLYVSCDSLIIAAFTAFGPKYLENQFSLPAWLAGALFGAVLLPAGALGTIAGGAIISRFKLSCAQILKGELVLALLVSASTFQLLIQCENLQIAGVTVPYSNTSVDVLGSLNDSCNTDCLCNDVPYDPICSHDNVRFYSPCHAGCQTFIKEDLTLYYNCSCISPVMEEGVAPASSTACSESSCTTAPLYLVLLFVAVVCLFISQSMTVTATFRCVPVSQRSLAIGMEWIILRLVGSIPGPVVFGAVFDRACLLWDSDCGSQGSCLYYTNDVISTYLFAVCIALKLASAIFAMIAVCLYRAPPEVAITEDVALDDNGTPATNHNGQAIEDQRYDMERIKPNDESMGGMANYAFNNGEEKTKL